MAEHHALRPQRITQRLEVRRFVRGNVDRLNRNLQRWLRKRGRLRKHFHFVLVAVAGNRQHLREKIARNAAQPRLRIGHGRAREQPENLPRPPVAKPAPQRHITRKSANPQNDAALVTA